MGGVAVNLIEQIQKLDDLAEELEDFTQGTLKALEPHIEWWNGFIRDFSVRWREEHKTSSEPLGEPFPWREVVPGDLRGPAGPSGNVEYRQVSLGPDRVFISGQYPDGDVFSFWIPVDFILDQWGTKQRLIAEWTQKAGEVAQEKARAREDKERKEYERLRAKFGSASS